MEKIGRFVKEKRELRVLSLREASKLSGVSHTHIRDIEEGRSNQILELLHFGQNRFIPEFFNISGTVFQTLL